MTTGVPTGMVTFLSGQTQIGTGTVDGTGTATFTTSSLAAGTYSIKAMYGGDSNFAASTSTAVTVAVNAPVSAAAATTTVLSASPTTVNVDANITFTVKVSSIKTGVPTGTVTFSIDQIQVVTVPLDNTGSLTYTVPAPVAGTYSITAVYDGNANFAASTSSTVTVTVKPATTSGFTLTLSPTSGSVAPGSSSTTTVSVNPTGGFNQPVALSCTGAPTYSTCSISAASVTPNGSAAIATVTITTDVSTAANTGTEP